ncbi:MAG: DNA-directed RNA polymerase subunit omega [bacterium]
MPKRKLPDLPDEWEKDPEILPPEGLDFPSSLPESFQGEFPIPEILPDEDDIPPEETSEEENLFPNEEHETFSSEEDEMSEEEINISSEDLTPIEEEIELEVEILKKSQTILPSPQIPLRNPDEISRTKEEHTGSRLDWLVCDFSPTTETIYEAVIVAAKRAREIALTQKMEIDRYFQQKSSEPQPISEDDNPNLGIDPFHHIKPTVLALQELKEGKIRFYNPKNRDKNLSSVPNPSRPLPSESSS